MPRGVTDVSGATLPELLALSSPGCPAGPCSQALGSGMTLVVFIGKRRSITSVKVRSGFSHHLDIDGPGADRENSLR